MHGVTKAHIIKHYYLGLKGSLWNLHTEPLEHAVTEPHVEVP